MTPTPVLPRRDDHVPRFVDDPAREPRIELALEDARAKDLGLAGRADPEDGELAPVHEGRFA